MLSLSPLGVELILCSNNENERILLKMDLLFLCKLIVSVGGADAREDVLERGKWPLLFGGLI
jgi:hypothetical protein